MKKKYKILIGTHNKGKFKELSYLLSNRLVKIAPDSLGIKSPKENKKTFLGNSQLKAQYFYRKSKMISVSDDSGLSIDCLNGKPGIYSARWAKKFGNFNKAMNFIIKKVKEKNKNKIKKNTKAKFTCCLTIKIPHKKIISVTGIVKGKISYTIKGKNGFGYDPIFIPENHIFTFGEMNKRKKILIDHRFLAFKKLKKRINFL